jgi:hypothetical protein
MTNAEKYEFYKIEKQAQVLLDAWYSGRGHTVDRSSSCKDYDCVLDGIYKIEEKIRTKYWKDLLIEVIQDTVTNSPGWAYETKCDYLHYVFMDDDKLSLVLRINWKKFKQWYLVDYLSKKYRGNYITSIKGWGITINLVIPISDIPGSIINKFVLLDYENEPPF